MVESKTRHSCLQSYYKLMNHGHRYASLHWCALDLECTA